MNPAHDPILQRFKSRKVEKKFKESLKEIERELRRHSYQRICPSIRNRDSACFDIISNEPTRCMGSECLPNPAAARIYSRSVCGRRILEPKVLSTHLEMRKREESIMSKKDRQLVDSFKTGPSGRGSFNILNHEQLLEESNTSATTAWGKLCYAPKKQ